MKYEYVMKNTVTRQFCQSCERLLPERDNLPPGYFFKYCPYCGEKLDWKVIRDRYTEYWDRLDRENHNDVSPWWYFRPTSKKEWEKNPEIPHPRWKRAGEGNREYVGLCFVPKRGWFK